MPNPYAARSRRTADESTSELDLAIRRLRTVGATDDEVTSFVAGWDQFEDGIWTPEIRRAWLRQRDSDLVAELQAIRLEYEIGTVTEEEAAARDADRARQALVSEAVQVIGGTIRQVLAWVGDDPLRAEVAAELEASDVGAQRRTLMAQLGTVLR